jgi:hypothetical protein
VRNASPVETPKRSAAFGGANCPRLNRSSISGILGNPGGRYDVSVCIAARTIAANNKAIVFCMDMMGSTDWNSSETLFKWHTMPHGFFALLAGPIETARELASHCGGCFQNADPRGLTVPSMLKALREGIGCYKRDFADTYIRSRLGISYEEFREHGRLSFPDDLYREVAYEVRNHYSSCELVVFGFMAGGSPRIFKVSSDSALSCDSFAVIGTGTSVAESALFFRGQGPLTDLDSTVYSVYEAKRLAENAPGVGKKTLLFIMKENGKVDHLTDIGGEALNNLFAMLAPKQILKSEPFPAGSFVTSPI